MSTLVGGLPASLARYGFTGHVPPSGNGSCGVMLVGEAPGDQEVRHGEPFYRYAPAGSMLERALKRVGVSRDQFTITNVVWSQPPRNWLEGAPWEREAVEAFRPTLDDLIARTQPKVIMPLGNVALRRFTGYGGKATTITAVRGYTIACPAYNCWVVPALHPAFIVRGQQHLTGVLIRDIYRALEVARDGHEPAPVRYITHPRLDDALEFERGYNPARHILSFDIETPESDKLDEEEVEEEGLSFTIVRVSFCYETHYAISMPWAEPFIGVAKRLLASQSIKRAWNAGFDIPRLESNGAPVVGLVRDVMWHFKHLQPSLRRALGMVAPFYGWDREPWKQQSSSEPEWYSCADADATQRCGEGVERDLRAIGLWESVQRHVDDLTPVLCAISRNGLPMDLERLANLRECLKGQYDERFAALQSAVPDELKAVHPKDGYKKMPADTTGMRLIRVPVLTPDGNGGLGLCEGTVERWARIEPFLPKSVPQVAAYAKSKGHKLGTNRKTKAETTDADTLKRLFKRHKDLVYRLILECRNLQDYTSRYVNGWKPGANALVHATPGYWGDMYRISWRAPNIGATNKDKDEEAIAKGFRECVAAPPGYVFVEGDWVGIESKLVGYFAGDAEYMRLASIGVHDFFLSHVLVKDGVLAAPADLSWPDADLRAMFKDLKRRYPARRDDAKHCVHGTNYGMTPYLMAQQYNMTLKDAQYLYTLYFDLFPKVRKWQEQVMEQAHRQAYLTLPFGYRMWFWDVFHYNSKTDKMVRGEDAKSAVAFIPRDTAAFILRDCLLRLREHALAGVIRANVHDSILGMPREADADQWARMLKDEMERPVPELNDLGIGAEIKVGPNWAEDAMEVWRG